MDPSNHNLLPEPKKPVEPSWLKRMTLNLAVQPKSKSLSSLVLAGGE